MDHKTEIERLCNEITGTVKTRYDELSDRMDAIESGWEKMSLDTDRRTERGTEQRSGPLLGVEQKAAHHWRYDDGIVAKDVRLGALIAGIVGGERVKDQLSDMEHKSLLSGLTSSAGGYVIPTAVAGEFIDAARVRSTVLAAGARTFPMNARTVTIPGWDTPPSAAWRNEGAAFAEQAPSFRAVTLNAKSLAATLTLSIELLEDAESNLPAVAAIVEDAIAKAMATELDRALLVGSGVAPEPQGLYGSAGVAETTAIGVPAYADMTALVYDVKTRNHEPNAIIYAPRTGKTFADLADTTGQPLSPPEAVSKLARYESGNVPVDLGAGTNESLIFCGDFAKLVLGVRPSMAVRAQLDPYTEMAGSGSVRLNVYLRADVAVLDPDAFQVASGVTP
jgi:HK97 family phage major capsid protein